VAESFALNPVATSASLGVAAAHAFVPGLGTGGLWLQYSCTEDAASDRDVHQLALLWHPAGQTPQRRTLHSATAVEEEEEEDAAVAAVARASKSRLATILALVSIMWAQVPSSRTMAAGCRMPSCRSH